MQKCNKVPNMRQSHIRIFLTCLHSARVLWSHCSKGPMCWPWCCQNSPNAFLARCCTGWQIQTSFMSVVFISIFVVPVNVCHLLYWNLVCLVWPQFTGTAQRFILMWYGMYNLDPVRIYCFLHWDTDDFYSQ